MQIAFEPAATLVDQHILVLQSTHWILIPSNLEDIPWNKIDGLDFQTLNIGWVLTVSNQKAPKSNRIFCFKVYKKLNAESNKTISMPKHT